VAADCDGEAPRRERAPLGSRPDPAALKRWLRRWTNVRHREAAERTLLTAIAAGFSPAELADALFAAETERAFADTGHSLDFINKAFECLDLVGWQHAAALLPTVVGQMVAARGAEESTAWRQPVDLVALCEESTSELADLFAAGRGSRDWSGHAALAQELLGDDPARIIDALKEAIRAGAAPADLGQSLAYAAALRVARFGNANEHADWETAHHVFTCQRSPPDAAAHRDCQHRHSRHGRPRRIARSDGALPCSLSQCAASAHPGRRRRAAR
jgi:hypothetical protein